MVTFHLSNERLIFTTEEVPAWEEVFASTAELCSVDFSLSSLLWRKSLPWLAYVICVKRCKLLKFSRITELKKPYWVPSMKDTTAFINFLGKKKTKIGKDTILVSMDVSSLYTNIPQEEGTNIVFIYTKRSTTIMYRSRRTTSGKCLV